MAMTKAEKAKLEELETALALCWPGYPEPKPMTRDEIAAAPKVPIKSVFTRNAVAGFFINSHSLEISEGFSDGMSHSRRGGQSWSQNMGQMYRSKREAAMALRYAISRDSAKRLAAVDRIIRESEG